MVKVACAVWPLARGGAAEAARHAGAGTEAAPASAEMATTDGGAGRALPPSAAPHSSQYCASSAFSVRHLSQVFMAFALRSAIGHFATGEMWPRASDLSEPPPGGSL